jgi:hypothetical protein
LGLCLGVGDRGCDELSKIGDAALSISRKHVGVPRRDDDHSPRTPLDRDRADNSGGGPDVVEKACDRSRWPVKALGLRRYARLEDRYGDAVVCDLQPFIDRDVGFLLAPAADNGCGAVVFEAQYGRYACPELFGEFFRYCLEDIGWRCSLCNEYRYAPQSGLLRRQTG